jgi:hypothetical protein
LPIGFRLGLRYALAGDIAASPRNGHPIQALLALFWSEHMDGLSPELPIFPIAAFADALVAGLSGFASGLVVSSNWLYILAPLPVAALIVAFGLIKFRFVARELLGHRNFRHPGA